MTVPTTTSFSYTRDQIIQFAMRKLGILEPGATPDPNIVQNFSDELNLMIKSWITKGIKLWTITEQTIPFTENKNTYTLGLAGSAPYTVDIVTDKPMKIKQAWLRNVSVTLSNDIPLQLIAQFNYNEFGSKQSTGTPNSVWMNVLRDQSQVVLYPTPDTTVSSLYQLHIITQRQLYDITLSTNNLDFPIEWYYAIGWNLAYNTMVDFGVDEKRATMITMNAREYLKDAEDFDTEYTSVYFAADQRYSR